MLRESVLSHFSLQHIVLQQRLGAKPLFDAIQRETLHCTTHLDSYVHF
jgi:hypothetical protein